MCCTTSNDDELWVSVCVCVCNCAAQADNDDGGGGGVVVDDDCVAEFRVCQCVEAKLIKLWERRGGDDSADKTDSAIQRFDELYRNV